jgi:hypothetical protein
MHMGGAERRPGLALLPDGPTPLSFGGQAGGGRPRGRPQAGPSLFPRVTGGGGQPRPGCLSRRNSLAGHLPEEAGGPPFGHVPMSLV